MCWKESVGTNNQPIVSMNEEDIKKLETVEGQDMTYFKPTALEQVRKWKKMSEEGSRSQATTGKIIMNFFKNLEKKMSLILLVWVV